MRRWSTFLLAIVVALVFALIGFYYLMPGFYHPLSADTVKHTTPHLTIAAVFWVLAGITLVLGSFVRPIERD